MKIVQDTENLIVIEKKVKNMIFFDIMTKEFLFYINIYLPNFIKEIQELTKNNTFNFSTITKAHLLWKHCNGDYFKIKEKFENPKNLSLLEIIKFKNQRRKNLEMNFELIKVTDLFDEFFFENETIDSNKFFEKKHTRILFEKYTKNLKILKDLDLII